MQGSAKRSRHIMYTEAHLISFGNYLLRTYGVKVHSSDGKNQPIYDRMVSHADFCNWEYMEKPDKTLLPSRHQLDEKVVYDIWGNKTRAEILAVHFYPGKVKYDLELLAPPPQLESSEPDTTRIYNVDSFFVQDAPALE
jgi:hypothetical protein